MIGAIIWYVVTIGCAILFYSIGAYALKYDKPIWFWSGSEVHESEISDIKQYNKENSKMWKLYSLWYFASGLAYIWNVIIAIIILMLGCSVGIIILVRTYNKIYNKYKV